MPIDKDFEDWLQCQPSGTYHHEGKTYVWLLDEKLLVISEDVDFGCVEWEDD